MKTIGSMDPQHRLWHGGSNPGDLGVQSMRLISNSESSFKGIGNYGLEIVEKVPLSWEAK